MILNKCIILDERLTQEKEGGIHHEIYQTIGTVWAHIALKRDSHVNGHANQPCVYSFVVRKSDRLTGCTLGRLHWGDKTLYVTNVAPSEKYPQYLIGQCIER
jgi:hypothetical protein